MKQTKLEIHESGKKLFQEKGFKNTSIADITTATDIGVGTFYNFYTSKEHLFAEIFFDEILEVKRHIFTTVNCNDDLTTLCKGIITGLFNGIRTNPILREWYNRETFRKISKKINIDDISKNQNDISYQFFIDLIDQWQTSGKVSQAYSTDFILALFNSLSFIDLHREEIGEQHFPLILDVFVECIVKEIKQ